MPASDRPAGRVALRVQPRSKRPGISVDGDGGISVAVAAPAVDGAANRAVVDLCASYLAVPPSRILIVGGAHGRSKVLEVVGLDAGAIRERLVAAAKKDE